MHLVKALMASGIKVSYL